jgi:hypothetical protein
VSRSDKTKASSTIRVDGGRWFIVKQKQAAGGVFADRPVIAAGAADEILEAPVTTLQGPVAPQPPIVASQPSTLALSVAPQPTLSPSRNRPSLRRNHRRWRCPLRRNRPSRLLLGHALVALPRRMKRLPRFGLLSAC